MKVGCWPGCVSRGFTPELHGSMAKVAPLLDIELVELDRACCTGAGVIAEQNQELADTLNARTFALAQQVERRGDDDEHLLHVPGRAVASARSASTRTRSAATTSTRRWGPRACLREGHREQALPLADGRGDRAGGDRREGLAAADRPAHRPVLRLLHRPPDRPAGDRAGAPARQVPAAADRGARRHRRRLRGPVQVLRLPDHHDEQGSVAPAGGRHLGDAVDADADCLVTPCPLCHLNLDLQQPLAEKCRRPAAPRMPVLHLPQMVGLAFGLDPKELGLGQARRRAHIGDRLVDLGGRRRPTDATPPPPSAAWRATPGPPAGCGTASPGTAPTRCATGARAATAMTCAGRSTSARAGSCAPPRRWPARRSRGATRSSC